MTPGRLTLTIRSEVLNVLKEPSKKMVEGRGRFSDFTDYYGTTTERGPESEEIYPDEEVDHKLDSTFHSTLWVKRESEPVYGSSSSQVTRLMTAPWKETRVQTPHRAWTLHPERAGTGPPRKSLYTEWVDNNSV